MKRLLVVLLMLTLALTLVSAGPKQEVKEETPAETKEEPAPAAAAKPIKNPDTFIVATIGDPQSLDPARAYDTSAGDIMYNIYDSLIDFDGADAGSFVPNIALEVPTVANGGLSADGKTYRFKIRSGVTFSNGYPPDRRGRRVFLRTHAGIGPRRRSQLDVLSVHAGKGRIP